VLGTGHARFFYDKLGYVENRYKQIEHEMHARGFKTNPNLELSDLPKNLFNSWTPTKDDKILNLNRIIARISDKPKWYKFKNAQMEDWVDFYEKRYDFTYNYDIIHYGKK